MQLDRLTECQYETGQIEAEAVQFRFYKSINAPIPLQPQAANSTKEKISRPTITSNGAVEFLFE